MRSSVAAGLIAFGLLVPVAANAQARARNQSLALYGLAPFVNGDVVFGERGDDDIDIDAGDVLDSLEIAATARYRAQSERWAFVLDGQFLGLGDTQEKGDTKVDLEIDQLVVQADAAYRFSKTAEVLFGVRYLEFEAEAEVRTPARTRHGSADESFTDAVVGLRTEGRFGNKMLFQAQGDIGAGDMDLSWQTMFHLGYLASDAISLWFGYRALGLDFDETTGPDGANADLIVHGPVVGIAFHF